ncbi:MAG: hypothetical protein WC758_05220 [Candidatus Woesearchaeota archaeon]|jgi:hypothetical protein
MDILLIVHILAALFTILFVIYTAYQIFHRYSIQHRIYALTARIRPMIISKNSKQHIVELLKLDGFPEEEIEEMYTIINTEIQNKLQTAKIPPKQ